jgi:ABC-type multidrug transport system ATPase subunit
VVSSPDAVPTTTTLSAENLDKRFSGPPLFSGLSFAAKRGLVAVSGRNGSGKTTLLKILAGLVRPSSGRVILERGGAALADGARRLAVGWAGPDLAFYGELTGEENLRFFRKATGRPAESGEMTRRLLDAGLSEEAIGRRVEEYSTGMVQRLRIAFARLFDPEILLLDEPTAGLDAQGREMVRRVVEESRRAGTVVVASNDERDFDEPDQMIVLGGREAEGGRR